MENLKKLVSLQDQVQEVRLLDKLGKQNYHHKTEKLFEPVIDIIKNISEIITKISTETSIINNKVKEFKRKKYTIDKR